MSSRFAFGYEWRLALRHLRATRGRGFVSFISAVSVAGLALGVAVLLVVLSVVNGFERELHARIVNVSAHASLSDVDGRMGGWQSALEFARAQPGVRAASPFIEAQGMLTHAQQAAGVLVRGIDPVSELRVSGLVQALDPTVLARLAEGRYGIVLGDALAEALQTRVGEQVVLMVPEASMTPAGMAPRLRRFTVAGLFHSGMYEYDRGLALLNLADAARLYRLGDAVTGIRIAVLDPYRARGIIDRLANGLSARTHRLYSYSDWTRDHGNFFQVIAETRSLMFVILSLLVAIAAFNLLATLVMVVKDKRSDIAILRTMGAAPGSMLASFAIQGTLVGLLGTALGALLGWLVATHLTRWVAWLERVTGQSFIDARLYYISDLPAAITLRDVLSVCGVAFLLCLLATLYPAWRAARTAPAEALRHD